MSDEIEKVPPPDTQETAAVLKKALGLHLQAIAFKPISIASCIELQKTAILSRKLLSLQNPKEQLMQRGLGSNQIISGYNIDADFDNDLDGPNQYGTAIAPAPPVETFGASILRELIPALKKNATPRLHLSELMEAKNMAVRDKDDKLAERIQERITRLLEEDLEEDVDPASPPPDEQDSCTHPGCIAPAAVGSAKGKLCLEHYDDQSIEEPKKKCEFEGCSDPSTHEGYGGFFCWTHYKVKEDSQ